MSVYIKSCSIEINSKTAQNLCFGLFTYKKVKVLSVDAVLHPEVLNPQYKQVGSLIYNRELPSEKAYC